MKNTVVVTLLLPLVMTSVSGQQLRDGVFLHHSTGASIWGPNGSTTSVPIEVAAYNSAHGFRHSEVATLSETWWPVSPSDNNEWERWHRIFENGELQSNIDSVMSLYAIVVIKSCYPSSQITSVGTSPDTLSPTTKSIYNYKWHWRSILRVMEMHPENFFVIWTNAPMVAAVTNAANAQRADSFCRWAKDTLAQGLDSEYRVFPRNVYVFDFFHKLAGADGMLPASLATSLRDSHPNAAATELVAPQFVREIFDAAIAYENGVIVPPAPALVSPANGVIGQPTTLNLSWTASTGSVSYRLQVSTDMLFGTTVVDDSTITETSRQVGPLTKATTYYWRVNANNGGGTSAYTNAWNFTTVVQVPGPVLIVSPAHGAVIPTDTVRVVWKHSSLAVTRYWYEQAGDSVFLHSTIDSTLTDTTKLVRFLSEGQRYWWRVRAMNEAGWGSYSETRAFSVVLTGVSTGQELPAQFSLSQNYPNPFNPTTHIEFALPRESRVKLEVFNALGQLVALVIDGERQAGYYAEPWNSLGLPSGVYFYRLQARHMDGGQAPMELGQAGHFVQAKKLLLVK